MRQGSRNNIEQQKKLARRKYSQRQIDKFIKWSISRRGYLRWSDLVFIHNKYNIKVNG